MRLTRQLHRLGDRPTVYVQGPRNGADSWAACGTLIRRRSPLRVHRISVWRFGCTVGSDAKRKNRGSYDGYGKRKASGGGGGQRGFAAVLSINSVLLEMSPISELYHFFPRFVRIHPAGSLASSLNI